MTTEMQQRIERLLETLLWQWGRLPAVEAEIDRWDLMDQLTFLEEWPLEEMRLKQLADYAEADAFTPDQAARYRELLRVVECNRPILRRLQAS